MKRRNSTELAGLSPETLKKKDRRGRLKRYTAKALAVSLIATTASIAAISPVGAVQNPPVSGPGRGDPAGFFAADGTAPNDVAFCDSPTYFDEWNNWDLTGDDDFGPWTIDTGAGQFGGGVVATLTETNPGTGHSSGNFAGVVQRDSIPNFGVVVYGGGTQAEISLSEPLFYSQWVLLDVDVIDEGFAFEASFNGAAGPVGGTAVFGGRPTHLTTATQPNMGEVEHDGADNADPNEIGTRGQIDFLGVIDFIEIDKIGANGNGASGIIPGGGCTAMGSAKAVTGAPTWDSASQTWTTQYTVQVLSNLPSQANLDANLAAAAANAAANGFASTVPAPGTIPESFIENFQISDNLSVPGVNVDSVSLSSTTGLPLNAAYDGVTDTNIVDPASGFALAPEELQEVVIDVVYSPDFSNPDWSDGCTSFENQTNANGLALTAGVSDLSDSGIDPAAGALNGDDSTDTPTPVELCINAELDTTKTVTTSTLNADGTIAVVYDLTVDNIGDVAMPVNVSDDLDAAFGAGSTYSGIAIVATGPCAGFENNSGYDGAANTDLITPGAVVLGAGVSCTITLSFQVDPTNAVAASPGTAFTNTVEVEGEIGVLQANDTASATFNEVAVPVAEDDSVLGVIVGAAVTPVSYTHLTLPTKA